MLEREGLVEEPGQDKGTDKVKEGTVEEDGTHLAPFDFTIIGTTGQEHHVWSSQLSIEYENEDQSDGKDKGEDKTRKAGIPVAITSAPIIPTAVDMVR